MNLHLMDFQYVLCDLAQRAFSSAQRDLYLFGSARWLLVTSSTDANTCDFMLTDSFKNVHKMFASSHFSRYIPKDCS